MLWNDNPRYTQNCLHYYFSCCTHRMRSRASVFFFIFHFQLRVRSVWAILRNISFVISDSGAVPRIGLADT